MMNVLIALAIVFVVCGIGLLILKPILASLSLKTRFVNAGVLSGRTKADICAAVGNPNATTYQADGSSLVQWIEELPIGGYHVVLLFDRNNVCIGVTQEYDTMT